MKKYQLGSLICLFLPIICAFYVSYYSDKVYEASASLIMTPGRSVQAISGSENEKARDEQVAYEQVVKSQITIILTDDVIRSSIKRVELKNIYPDLNSAAMESSVNDHEESEETESYAEAVERIKSKLTVSSDLNTFVIRLRFRDKNPVIAKSFLNALLKEYLAKKASLYSKPEAEAFFTRQERDYENQLQAANLRLQKFSLSSGVFDISEQRTLLLGRLSEATKSLSETQESIKKIGSEIDSYRTGISSLKLRLNLPPEIYGNSVESKPIVRNEGFAGDPPLLNVKLYQQMAEKLVDANATLSGLQSLSAEQKHISQSINVRLEQLQAYEAEFMAIKRQITRFEDYINSLSKRSIDARINGEWGANDNFSGAQILQSANLPISPVFPRPLQIISLGVILGIILFLLVIYISKMNFINRKAIN